MGWNALEAPPGLGPPNPLLVRAQSIPPRHEFPEHAHDWNQVVYAISGVLTVVAGGRSMAISPEQAVWLPTGLPHRVGSLLGAEFRSLWIADGVEEGVPAEPAVISVSPLLKALIVEAADLGRDDDDGYRGRISHLIVDQLRRSPALPGALPWPSTAVMLNICEALYGDPADERSPAAWAKALGMSERTLARRFEADLGMSMRSWRRRVRLFKAMEMLGGDMGITEVAMTLGYGSTSAFVYAFRSELGCSPGAFLKRRRAD